VGEELQAAAKGEERLLRTDPGLWVVPARPADGPEQHRVARGDGIEVLGPEGRPVGVDRDAAGDDVQPLDRESVAGGHRIEHAAAGSDHLGAYPVAPDRRDPVRRHRRYGSSVVRGAAYAVAAAPMPAPWSLLTATRYAWIEASMMFVL